MFLKHDARTSIGFGPFKMLQRASGRRGAWIAIGSVALAVSAACLVDVSHLQAQPADAAPVLALAEQQPAMTNHDRLAKAITEYRNGQYEESLADLQQVQPDQLGDRDHRDLNEYMARADSAANQRKAARAEFEQGEQALAANKPIEAAAHYQAASNNKFVDEGTRAKSREQLAVAEAMMRQAGVSMRDMYNQAVADYKAGNLAQAKSSFEQLQNAGYKAGLFQKSPADYLKDVNAALAKAPAPIPAEQPMAQATPAPSPVPAPAPVETPPAPTPAVQTPVVEMAPPSPVPAPAPTQAPEPAPVVQTPPAPAPAPAPVVEAPPAPVPAPAPAPETVPAPAPVVTQAPPTPAPAVTSAPEATPAPVPAPAPVVEVNPQPAPVAPPTADARQLYHDAREQYRTGDWNSARKNFEMARDLGYKPGLFEDPPQRYIDRIDEKARRDKERTDAAIAAAQSTSGAAAQPGGEMAPAVEQAPPADALTRQDTQNQQQRDFISYTFRTAIDNANTSIASSKFDDAQAAIESARVARNINPGVFASNDLTTFDSQIAATQLRLDQAMQADKLSAAAKARAEAGNLLLLQKRQQEEETQRTISDLISESTRLTSEGKYSQAIGVIDQILKLDPNNEYAKNVRPLIEDRAIVLEQRTAREKFNISMRRQLNQAEEEKIPYSDILRFPDNWPDLSATRDRTVAAERGQQVEDAAVLAILEKKLPEVKFENLGLADVVQFLQDVSGANIVPIWRALETAGIDRNTPVNARLRDVKFSKVLDTILRDVGGGAVKLGYTVDEGVITISTADDLAHSSPVINFYDVRDLLVTVEDFNNPPNFQIQATQTGRGGGGGGNLFGGNLQQQNQNQNQRQQQVDLLIQTIEENVDRESWRDNGGSVGSLREYNSQLIVTQSPENHRQIVKLLEKLRETRAIQVTVEARFLTVQRNFLEEVGVDFDMVLNPGGQISSKLTPITVGNNSAAYTQIGNLTTSVPGNVATDLTSSSSSTQGVTPNLGLTGTNGAAITFLDDFQVSLLLRATQISQNATTLTAPRITLFNGQRAFVVVATETAYVSDLTPIVGTSAVAFDPTISIIQSGVLLDVQATVSSDRKYVTLTLRPTLTRLRSPLQSFPVSAIANTTGATGGTSQQIVSALVQQPVRDITSMNTTVSIPDGGTLLLGGQTLAGEVERDSGVPVLSKIPFLKRLFTNSAMAKDEQILLILVKPTIVIQREKEQDQFPTVNTRVSS
ncbi:MAG TPA: hypothetical protein VHD56_15280 [Tepidisphaeraceae bacterium]|nr:hypothetical protein [Tepidisphaeraceae bacterium]